MLPGNFNKACSAYFGGHYHNLYSGSSDEDYESPSPEGRFTEQRFTTRKAMTFIRRAKGQSFLAERKLDEWSFPCEVIEIASDGMILKQYIPEGGDDDYLEPTFKDTLLHIILEPEILEYVYLYRPHYTGNLIVGACILKRPGIDLLTRCGIWIKSLCAFFGSLLIEDGVADVCA
jgi:hypothetical protein